MDKSNYNSCNLTKYAFSIVPLAVVLTFFQGIDTQQYAHSMHPVQTASVPDEEIPLSVRIFFRPLPEKMPGSDKDTPEIIELGRRLFLEKEISLTKSQSCNDCHRLDDRKPGVDNLPTSPGAQGIAGTRNSSTVLNAGFQMVQFWDGRAENLSEQAKGPLLNPIEMAMRTEQDVISRLQAAESYAQQFKKAFPDQSQPVTFDNVANAIAAFQRTLIAPSRFDRYLKGETDVLSKKEKQGLHRFMDLHCTECHSSTPVGGRLLRKIGVYHSYENKSDQGRFEVTKQEDDRYVFKACMLRNVTLTAPYFHDGHVRTLSEAVSLMAWMQLDVNLNAADIDEVISFLQTLEGKIAFDVNKSYMPRKELPP